MQLIYSGNSDEYSRYGTELSWAVWMGGMSQKLVIYGEDSGGGGWPGPVSDHN